MIPGQGQKGNMRFKFLLGVILVLVALASFGLGRLSAMPAEEGSLIIHSPEAQ